MSFRRQLELVVKGKFLHRVDPRVLDLAERCEIVERTGWTMEYIDSRPAGEIDDMAAYWMMKRRYDERRRE